MKRQNKESTNQTKLIINQRGEKHKATLQKLDHQIFTIWCQIYGQRRQIGITMPGINIGSFSEKLLIHCDLLVSPVSCHTNSSWKVLHHNYSGKSSCLIKMLTRHFLEPLWPDSHLLRHTSLLRFGSSTLGQITHVAWVFRAEKNAIKFLFSQRKENFPGLLTPFLPSTKGQESLCGWYLKSWGIFFFKKLVPYLQRMKAGVRKAFLRWDSHPFWVWYQNLRTIPYAVISFVCLFVWLRDWTHATAVTTRDS